MTTTDIKCTHIACNGAHYVLNDSYAIYWTENDIDENGQIEIKLLPVNTINNHRYAIYAPLKFYTLRDIIDNSQIVSISSMILDEVTKYSDHILHFDDCDLYMYYMGYGAEDDHLLEFGIIQTGKEVNQSVIYTINVKFAYDDRAVRKFKSVPGFIADCQYLLYDGAKYTTKRSAIMIIPIEGPAWEISEEVSL